MDDTNRRSLSSWSKMWLTFWGCILFITLVRACA